MAANMDIKKSIKNEEKSFEEEKMIREDENIENNDINIGIFSFESGIDLDNFLSKKIEGLKDLDNLELDYKDKNKNGEQEIKKKNLSKNQSKKKFQGPEEILEILKKAWEEKKSPFKRLIKPKHFSLEGKILFYSPNN